MSDTDPEIAARYRAMLMACSEDERFRMGLSMCETARAIVLSTLPAGLDGKERKIALLHRYYASSFRPAKLAKIEAALG